MISDKSTNKSEVLTEEEIVEMYAPPKSYRSTEGALSFIHQIRSEIDATNLVIDEVESAIDEDGDWIFQQKLTDGYQQKGDRRIHTDWRYNIFNGNKGYVEVKMTKRIGKLKPEELSAILFLSSDDTREIREKMKELLSMS